MKSRLLITVLSDLNDSDWMTASVCAVRAAQRQSQNPDWCQGAIVTFSGGWVCSTSRTKTGFSVKVWRDDDSDSISSIN